MADCAAYAPLDATLRVSYPVGMTLVAAAQDAAAVAAVTAVLAAHDGNRTRAARTLGWSRQGLYGWLEAHPAVAQAYPARLRGRPLGSGKKSVTRA